MHSIETFSSESSTPAMVCGNEIDYFIFVACAIGACLQTEVLQSHAGGVVPLACRRRRGPEYSGPCAIAFLLLTGQYFVFWPYTARLLQRVSAYDEATLRRGERQMFTEDR